MNKYFIPNIEARKSLADKLNLEYHENMQDWEYEVADYNRLKDFENQYLLTVTNKQEKESLMEIMLDCLNDLLEENDLKTYDNFAPRVLNFLTNNKTIHEGTINYWTNGNFLISEKIEKKIIKKGIIDWLNNIEKLDGKPPVEVIAFNFGLIESDKGFMLYIVGAFEYSEEDDDWACIEPPTKPYRYLRFPDYLQNKSWDKILEYSAETLKELEKEGIFNETFLSDAKAITTGFDDGELIKIR